MATVFIFHGIQGSPSENWFPWLKTELEKAGHRVIVPAFPHPEKPVLQEWMDFFAQYEENVGLDTVFVGHSLGAAFALRELPNLPRPIGACFLVAPVWEVMGNKFDPAITTFTTPEHDWSLLQSQCESFTVIHGMGDPYITKEKSEALAQYLNVEPVFIQSGGHFNDAANYKEFPDLRDRILAKLKE